MRKISLHLFTVILGMVICSSVNAQKCLCDSFHKRIFALFIGDKVKLKICGELLDSYGKDKIITEFFVTDCQADSMIEDDIHDEGDAFLVKTGTDSVSIILIEEPFDKSKPIPSIFEDHLYYIKNGELMEEDKNIASAPIEEYLKNFKQYQK